MSYAGSLLDLELDRAYSPMSLGRLRRSYSMGAFPSSGYMNPYYPADDLYVGTRYSMYGGGGGYPPMSSWSRRRHHHLYPDMRRRSLMSDYMYPRGGWNPYGAYSSYPYGSGGGYGGGYGSYYNPYGGGYGGYGGYGMGMSGMGMSGMGMSSMGMGGMGYGGYSDYDYGYGGYGGYGGNPYYSGLAY